MEMPEDPTERLQDDVHEHAERARKQPWVLRVAVSTAFFAALAAITSLLAGHEANDAMMEQIRASDQWSHYQAKTTRAAVLESKAALLVAMSRPAESKDSEKLAEYERDRKELGEKAEELTRSSESHFRCHMHFARGVTLFQVAIALAAVAILAQRKEIWYGSWLLAGIGIVFVVLGLAAILHAG